jgi:cysteine synthase B|tara:strand:+ start:13883 stop:14932 length:1050 start_codon:yes stop_codon:yes gene_type:complete
MVSQYNVRPDYKSIDDLIGNTPLVRLDKINPYNNKFPIYAKLEWYNPFGSLKDRPALWMIKEAERKGLIKKGETIVIEPTSGNTGVALAGLCLSLGYDVEVVVPKKISSETKLILKDIFGVKTHETDDDLCPRVGPGTDQAIALAQAKVNGPREDGKKYFVPNQYGNEANFRAHYEATGPEIWRDTEGKITHFITGVGTGGTVTGVSTYLKEQNSAIKTVAVQPQKGHHLQGLRNLEESQMPDVLKRRRDVIDDLVTISDEEAFKAVSNTARSENLFLGPSCGATLSVALDLADRVKDGVGVVIFGDSGHKYWSVFDEFGVFTREEFERLQSSANYLAKPLFLDDRLKT